MIAMAGMANFTYFDHFQFSASFEISKLFSEISKSFSKNPESLRIAGAVFPGGGGPGPTSDRTGRIFISTSIGADRSAKTAAEWETSINAVPLTSVI